MITGGRPRLGIIRRPGDGDQLRFRIPRADDYRLIIFGAGAAGPPADLVLRLSEGAYAPGRTRAFTEKSGPYGNPAITVHFPAGDYIARVVQHASRETTGFSIQVVRLSDPG
jgi:hypothetical protein